MKTFFHLILFFAGINFLIANPQETPQQVEDSITVYIFMLEDCIITQNYTLALRNLYENYHPFGIEFIGLFPNAYSKEEKIDSFQVEYQIPFELKKDEAQNKTQQLGVSVTPEVVIYNHSADSSLYQGRIDNSYFRVGKKRTITTTSELEDALQAIVDGREIEVKKTEAIGCFINLQRKD